MRNSHSQRRAGFTLTELMVVIVILGLLMATVGQNVIRNLFQSEQTKAEMDVKAISDAIRTYYLTNHKVPKMEELTTVDQKGQSYLEGFETGTAPRDPWGNAYEIREGERPGTWEVISYGRDKLQDTEDDINSRRLIEDKNKSENK